MVQFRQLNCCVMIAALVLIISCEAHAFNDPVTGRWITRDPIGYADGLNLYEYLFSNSSNWLDPTGYSALTDWLAKQRKQVEQDARDNRQGIVCEAICTAIGAFVKCDPNWINECFANCVNRLFDWGGVDYRGLTYDDGTIYIQPGMPFATTLTTVVHEHRHKLNQERGRLQGENWEYGLEEIEVRCYEHIFSAKLWRILKELERKSKQADDWWPPWKRSPNPLQEHQP